MLLEALESTTSQAGGIFGFIFVILIWVLIVVGIIFLIKKVIKPILNYFKTKQDYYAAQTETLKNAKDKG